MNQSMRFFMGVLVTAFALAGVTANPAMAQDKAAKGSSVRKVLLENDKVRVYENTQKPGEVNDAVPTTKFRVVRVLKGSTLVRTYADGKKETLVRKTGDVLFNQPGPGYTNMNAGKTDYQTYVVEL